MKEKRILLERHKERNLSLAGCLIANENRWLYSLIIPPIFLVPFDLKQKFDMACNNAWVWESNDEKLLNIACLLYVVRFTINQSNGRVSIGEARNCWNSLSRGLYTTATAI